MQLGIGQFTCQQRPDDDRPMNKIYDEMLELGCIIDDAGLDSAWVSEYHFSNDGYMPGIIPALSALAAVTNDIELGPCIALAPLYNPIRLAEDIATIDLIAGGRTTLGFGIGSNIDLLNAFGIAENERVDRLTDTIDVIRGAWSEGPLNYESNFHETPADIDVTPKPAHDVPIMFGGVAKPAVRRAARIGDGWCAPQGLPLEAIRKRVADIETVRENEGIDSDFQVYLVLDGFVGDSHELAWETMREGYFYTTRRYAEIDSGEPVDELSTEQKRDLKEQAIFGTAEQVVNELQTYRDALGDDVHIIFRSYHPNIGTEEMASCIRRLGDEVRPELVRA
ncbi:LLM class flavin-dependent oxidoreductase [Natrialba sp. PRR66]|uniref:LLM class flavin-dependent oxidoreductase n=1 Tax=Natrialba sp. PRR66 TaxID=3098146 RepID=UPI002B1E61A6|nr:LLM class flavin-dependent oxidoreductase [Natrialba sp. PRR66]